MEVVVVVIGEKMLSRVRLADGNGVGTDDVAGKEVGTLAATGGEEAEFPHPFPTLIATSAQRIIE